ncbi:MAG TPA: hypothetical protein VNA69_12240 [Thermoanaerobaculia bacterium]|nr:hypothetical protein [Thermoanaerobaculia bacterium]
MRCRALFAAALALAAFGASAETLRIVYRPVSCIRGGELPVLQMNIEGEGELRAYFRLVNTTDWCSVEGTNDGPLSRIVLPKFDTGDEIEYFIVLIQGMRVMARSPRIYRASVTNECEAAFARHIIKVSLSCGDEPNGIPTSMYAGYKVSDSIIIGRPPIGSPDRPDVPPEPPTNNPQ